MSKEIFVGISGTNCSGKDSAADFLAGRLNLFNISLSDVLRTEALIHKVPQDRHSLVELSKKLPRDPSGLGALAIRALGVYEELQENYEYSGMLMGSIRCTVDAEAIKRKGGKLIFIDAPIYTRYLWSLQRSREEYRESFAEFEEQDAREFYGVDDPYQPHQEAIKNMADYRVKNDSTPTQFQSKLILVAEEIKRST